MYIVCSPIKEITELLSARDYFVSKITEHIFNELKIPYFSTHLIILIRELAQYVIKP